jgi:hypothetical protein
MGAFTYIETDTGTNVDISAATAVGAYTSTGDKLIMVDVSIDAVAGNGDYVMYVTRKINGSGSAYRILPQTTMAAASGLTAISAQSGWITVRNGDVLTCYVDGLAGDTSTPDWSTRWFELAGVTASAIADAVLDEATADHTSAGSLSKAVADILTDTGTTLDGKIDTIDTNVDAILADTGTDGVIVASGTVTTLTNLPAAPTDWLTGAAVKADAVTKLQANLALEATLTAIKGAGWDTQTLAAIDVLIDAIKAKTDVIPASPAAAGEYTAAIGAIPTAPLLAANYVAPDNAGIAAIQAKTDDLTFTTPNKVDASATVDTSGVAGAVWDELLASHTDVGSAGAALAASGSAGDPWSTALPGAYAAGTAGKAIADIVAKTDQIDVSDVSFVTAVSGSTITILRGDTLSASLLNLGSLASYVTLDFTVKRSSQEADDDAIIRIRKNATGLTDGLVRLNGAAYTTGTDGSITITDAPTGDVTIMLKAGVTDDLVPGSYVYDIQLIEAAKVTTLTTGGLVVTADVTRLVA